MSCLQNEEMEILKIKTDSSLSEYQILFKKDVEFPNYEDLSETPPIKGLIQGRNFLFSRYNQSDHSTTLTVYHPAKPLVFDNLSVL